MSESEGKIFEIKRFAVHDGPGIRSTVFFKGCPLNCLWCHNPEGISQSTEIALLERRCLRCGDCLAACPKGLHRFSGERHEIDRVSCTFCLNCVKACLSGALKVYGEGYSAEALLERTLEDRDFYEASGGGLSCSGGEPMSQADFLAEFLKLCKNSGLHTAVDTSGHAPWESFKKVINFTDLFLYDLKHMDSRRHKELCGVDNSLILENLIKLSEAGSKIEVRVPVIPGLNDDEKNFEALAGFLKGIKTLTLVRPLPYHALSGSKYQSIGLMSRMPANSGSENERAGYASWFFKEAGLPSA